MTTALLILFAVLIVLALVGVVTQMCSSPFMWLMHACCGTIGTLLEVLAWVLAAIFEGIGSAMSS